ncbi:hypothetical protein, partial [Acetobacter orientalis]|uniref:hypothetical protein n=1 Tax=Acetobacter orientalis TaxID=146474 RepID=UPI001C5BA338
FKIIIFGEYKNKNATAAHSSLTKNYLNIALWSSVQIWIRPYVIWGSVMIVTLSLRYNANV